MGDPFGRTVITPFRLDPRGDPTTAEGLRNLRAALRQVLGTRAASRGAAGELRWKPAFGSRLETLRHSGNDYALAALAEEFVLESVARWEPRIEVTRVEAMSEGNVLRVRVTIRPRDSGPDRRVIPEEVVEVTL